MTSLSLKEKKKILELASIIKSLDDTQIKNLTKIVDNDTIQRMCCIIYSTCLKNRGSQIKKRLRDKILKCLCGKKKIIKYLATEKIVSIEKEKYCHSMAGFWVY
jgi:hypothetical protein